MLHTEPEAKYPDSGGRRSTVEGARDSEPEQDCSGDRSRPRALFAPIAGIPDR